MQKTINDLIQFNQNKIDYLKQSKKPKIGWLSIYTPQELFHAADVISYRMTGDSIEDISEAGVVMHRNICSYILGCLDEGIQGVHSFNDGVLFVDACDARRRMYDLWKINIKSNFSFLMDFPKDDLPVSRKYFKSQFPRLIETIESVFNCTITKEKLAESIRIHNKTRSLLKQISDYRKTYDIPVSERQIIQIIKASMTGLNEEINEKLEDLLQKIKGSDLKQSSKKPRILICGSYLDNLTILDVIEENGAKIVCEDISNGLKYFEGQIDVEKEPVEAIAEYYFDKASCARSVDTDKRVERIIDLVEDSQADAVIYFSLKFCDNNIIDYPYIRQKLVQKQVPVLFIEYEKYMTNIESIKTRLLTYLDTLI